MIKKERSLVSKNSNSLNAMIKRPLMTKNSEITSLKFTVISAIAMIMVFGAVAPSIIPASASHDEPVFDVTITKEVDCEDAVQFVQLDCTVWITNDGTDQTIIVETIPAGMELASAIDEDVGKEDCTVAASNANGKANSQGKSKGVGSTKVTCVLDAGEDIHFDIESRETKSGKQKPTSCGEGDDFEVNGGVDAYATDGAGNLLLVQLHDEFGNPIDGDGNPVNEGEFLVPILVDSTDPVFVDVECPILV
jgi:hypothetical protein